MWISDNDNSKVNDGWVWCKCYVALPVEMMEL